MPVWNALCDWSQEEKSGLSFWMYLKSSVNSSGIYMSFQKEINGCPFPNHLFIAAGLCGTTLVHCILESSLFAKHFTIFPLLKLLNLVMVHSSASPGASSSKVQLCFECKFTANSTAWHSSGWRTTYVCSSGQNLYPLELRVQEPRWDAWGCGSWKRFLSSFQCGLQQGRGCSASPSGRLWSCGCLELPPRVALLRSSQSAERQPCGLVARSSSAKSSWLDHSNLWSHSVPSPAYTTAVHRPTVSGPLVSSEGSRKQMSPPPELQKQNLFTTAAKSNTLERQTFV